MMQRAAARRTASIGLSGRPRDQQVVAGGDDALGNRGDLRRSLALAEDHFGKSLADAAVVIDAREAQVLERRLAQNIEGAARAPPQASALPDRDVVEQGAELLTVHRARVRW